jgi:hypothetical protein
VTLLETRPEPVAAALTAPVEPVGGPDPDQSPQLRSGRVLVAALLATSAAGWMAGGVFVELLARLVAVVAGAVGVGGVAWAVRRRRVFLLYLLAPAVAHRVVGYFEEEAVQSYTNYLALIDAGEHANVPAPEIARTYWRLPAGATLRDVVLAVREDEAGHRDVNHGYANELSGETGAARAASV